MKKIYKAECKHCDCVAELDAEYPAKREDAEVALKVMGWTSRRIGLGRVEYTCRYCTADPSADVCVECDRRG